MTIALTMMLALVTIAGIFVVKSSTKHASGRGLMTMSGASSTEPLPVSVETVGIENSELGNMDNSWPGEIVSFGDIEIQPRREGAIVEWRVNIGQKVRKGQIIANLSAPPAMPELISMLAEQTKMLTEARVDARAQIEFAEKKKQQLLALRETIDKSRNEAVSALNVSQSANSAVFAQEAINQAKGAAVTDQKKLHSALEQSIRKELQMFTHNEVDLVSSYKSGLPLPRIYVMDAFGKFNINSRYAYILAMSNALKEIVKEDGNLETVGAEYFQAAAKMAGDSYSDDEVSATQIAEIRRMIAMDQMAFLEALKEYRMSRAELARMEIEYKLMLAEKETDFAMQKKEIDEQIAMLEKDITMNNGRVEAAEAAYNTVAGSINGGQAIISPADGVISSVMKKNGDFVEPGMAVASLNNGRAADRFVRFRIPSNLRLPESGTELFITRPGFPKEPRRVKLIGVGTALDMNGSYLADAKFIDAVDWPVNISVRVLPNVNATSSLFVNLSALEWGNSGASLWLIKADDTIKKQPVKTGRTLGERVEVYEGLMPGDRYVAKLVPELKEGIKVVEGEKAAPVKMEEAAHGHE